MRDFLHQGLWKLIYQEKRSANIQWQMSLVGHCPTVCGWGIFSV